MSGIFGVVRLDGRPLDPGSLERMDRALAHRGPDGAGRWSDGPVGLGHRLLAATPESVRERQPLVDGAPPLVLVADVRLDNREELIRALGREAGDPGEVTDPGLVLAAWRRWGDRCPERLLGDFAFAVWDAARRSLACVRDPFGVKPLYFAHAPGRAFAFASEGEAILALPEFPPEIDDDEVARHLLVPIGGDPRATYYRHVRRAPAAHVLTVSPDGVEERRTWALDPTRETRLPSMGAYVEAFRDTFAEAVRCRLRSRSPVACMLSGGIDSSAIACVAAGLAEEAGAGPIHTLSAVYDRVPVSDERPYIDTVLARHSFVPHAFDAGEVDPLAGIDRMNRLAGGANWGINLYLNWKLCGVAASAGARVVLDGYDGDTTVSHGRGRLSELAIAGRWLPLARASVAYSLRRGASPVSDLRALVAFGRRRRRGAGPESQGPLRVPPGVPIDPDFAGRFTRPASSSPPGDTEREIHASQLTSTALLEALGWIEACGAGRGVEVRFPFFDVRLAELCLSFPSDLKLRRGWSRFVIRQAMEGILPPGIQWRKGKADLRPGWVHAYREHAGDRAEAILGSPNPAMRRYLDVDRLRASHRRFLDGAADPAEERGMWRALSLALWLAPADGGQLPIAP